MFASSLSDIIKLKHKTGTTATFGLVSTDIPLSKKIVCINSGSENLVCVPYNAVDHWNILCRNCVTWNCEAGVSYDMYIYYID